MSDREVCGKLTALVPEARCQFHEDDCIGVHLVSPRNAYYGVARHSKDKAEIVRLMSQLECLRYLDLRKNRITAPTINTQYLEYLDLASNYLGEVPQFIQYADELTYLNLGVNNLTEVPDFVVRPKLQVL